MADKPINLDRYSFADPTHRNIESAKVHLNNELNTPQEMFNPEDRDRRDIRNIDNPKAEDIYNQDINNIIEENKDNPTLRNISKPISTRGVKFLDTRPSMLHAIYHIIGRVIPEQLQKLVHSRGLKIQVIPHEYEVDEKDFPGQDNLQSHLEKLADSRNEGDTEPQAVKLLPSEEENSYHILIRSPRAGISSVLHEATMRHILDAYGSVAGHIIRNLSTKPGFSEFVQGLKDEHPEYTVSGALSQFLKHWGHYHIQSQISENPSSNELPYGPGNTQKSLYTFIKHLQSGTEYDKKMGNLFYRLFNNVLSNSKPLDAEEKREEVKKKEEKEPISLASKYTEEHTDPGSNDNKLLLRSKEEKEDLKSHLERIKKLGEDKDTQDMFDWSGKESTDGVPYLARPVAIKSMLETWNAIPKYLKDRLKGRFKMTVAHHNDLVHRPKFAGDSRIKRRKARVEQDMRSGNEQHTDLTILSDNNIPEDKKRNITSISPLQKDPAKVVTESVNSVLRAMSEASYDHNAKEKNQHNTEKAKLEDIIERGFLHNPKLDISNALGTKIGDTKEIEPKILEDDHELERSKYLTGGNEIKAAAKMTAKHMFNSLFRDILHMVIIDPNSKPGVYGKHYRFIPTKEITPTTVSNIVERKWSEMPFQSTEAKNLIKSMLIRSLCDKNE